MLPSQSQAQSFTRPELYDLVWSTPVVQLSKTLGISGPGLAKLCRRHSIPCPPRGYWAVLRHGKKVRKTRLPRPGVRSGHHDLDIPSSSARHGAVQVRLNWPARRCQGGAPSHASDRRPDDRPPQL